MFSLNPKHMNSQYHQSQFRLPDRYLSFPSWLSKFRICLRWERLAWAWKLSLMYIIWNMMNWFNWQAKLLPSLSWRPHFLWPLCELACLSGASAMLGPDLWRNHERLRGQSWQTLRHQQPWAHLWLQYYYRFFLASLASYHSRSENLLETCGLLCSVISSLSEWLIWLCNPQHSTETIKQIKFYENTNITPPASILP